MLFNLSSFRFVAISYSHTEQVNKFLNVLLHENCTVTRTQTFCKHQVTYQILMPFTSRKQLHKHLLRVRLERLWLYSIACDCPVRLHCKGPKLCRKHTRQRMKAEVHNIASNSMIQTVSKASNWMHICSDFLFCLQSRLLLINTLTYAPAADVTKETTGVERCRRSSTNL